MRKVVAAIVLLLSSLATYAQQLGVSGSLVGIIPVYDNVQDYSGYNAPLHHINHFMPGIRVEGNYLLKGFNFPISGYNGIGFTFVAPTKDSASYDLFLKSGGDVNVRRGIQRSSMLNFALQFGYEIPQNFNDFLTIHIGWGGGALSSRTVNLVPEPSLFFQYDPSDFDSRSFEPLWDVTANVEVFTGVVYELEKFSLIAQYAFLYGFNRTAFYSNSGIMQSHLRHQFSFGIFYTLKQF